MLKMIFVNLPVDDLAKSIAFYQALGFTLNRDFTNNDGAYLAWSDSIVVMLLTHEFYKKFIGTKMVADSRVTSEALLSFSLESKEEVDIFVKKVLDNGGKLLPIVEIPGAEGMYSRDLEDLDGHILEVIYMEMPAG
ncbi:MAG TPA: VOC family protein [Anaerolineaceae bacterium]|nr:VOC family protein [Anaerolineaceae bacterium]